MPANSQIRRKRILGRAPRVRRAAERRSKRIVVDNAQAVVVTTQSPNRAVEQTVGSHPFAAAAHAAVPANSKSTILAVLEGGAPRRRSRAQRGSSMRHLS